MIYTYQCESCSATFDRVCKPADYTPTEPCSFCGKTAARLFIPARLPQLSTFNEFVTTDITGKPERISSRKQEIDLCERHGVSPVTKDDMTGLRRPKVEMPSIHEDYQKLRQKVGNPSGDRAFDLIQGKK